MVTKKAFPDDHAHGEEGEGDSINIFDVNEMIPYVDTILREDDKVTTSHFQS